jgi:O-antigen ligase
MRAVGTSVDPNSYGGLLMIGFVLALGCLLARSTIAPRWVCVAALALTGAALLLTYSRGAWVGAFIGGLVLVAVRRPRWLLPGALIGGAAVTLGVGSAFIERLWLGFTLQDPATRLRLDEYRNAWAIIRLHPWFGVGFGDAPSIKLQAGVSSIYLTILERAGLVGLAAFLLATCVILGKSIPLIKEQSLVGDIALASTAALIAALTTGLVDHYFFNPSFAHMAALFWILAGLLVALQWEHGVGRRSFQRSGHTVRSSSMIRSARADSNNRTRGHPHGSRQT